MRKITTKTLTTLMNFVVTEQYIATYVGKTDEIRD